LRGALAALATFADLGRALIRYALHMPQGLDLFRGQIQDPCAEDPLGPDLEEYLEFPGRVCDGVGPDREVDDELRTSSAWRSSATMARRVTA
jgi:hypothetical protein